MAKYVVESGPGGKKTRVRRVEERRPGEGLDLRAIRGAPIERRTRLATVLAYWNAARAEVSDFADRWRLRGIAIFFVLVYVVPLAVLVVRECVRNEDLVGTSSDAFVGLGLFLVVGLLGLVAYRVVRPKRR